MTKDQCEVALLLEVRLLELLGLARCAGLDTLTHLLEMAAMEAAAKKDTVLPSTETPDKSGRALRRRAVRQTSQSDRASHLSRCLDDPAAIARD